MTACLHQSKFEMSLLLYPETMLSFLWSDIHKPYQSLLITAINYCLRRPLTLLSDATVAGFLVKRCLRSKCWNFIPWWRVTTLIWVIALHQYGISVGSFFRRRFAGKPATEASLNVGSFLRLHYYCSRHNEHSLNCISSYYCGLRFTTNQSHKCFEVTVYLETNWAIQQIFTVCV